MSFSEKIKKINDINLSDLKSLDFENIGSWPILAKIIACLLTILLVGSVGYYLLIRGQITKLNNVILQEDVLKKEFIIKQEKSANLSGYVALLENMEIKFDTLLKQLPTKTEVPGLLEDITLIGVRSGLVFDQIYLEPEIEKDFYIESPIKIKAQGGYHAIAKFISGIVGLSRIVTLHDFTIKKEQENAPLVFEILARTYRYKDIHTTSANKKSAKGQKH